MKIIEAAQGSQEWLQIRAKHFTASEAPAMLGLSKYVTRSELLKQKATGLTEEVDANKQRLFDAGHAAEAVARPLAEVILQEDLFPATGATEIDGLPLLASFDGLNMEETLVWENKLHSESLAAMMTTGDLGGTYWPQVEQQLLVSGATRALFTACDGEKITAQLWYESQPARRAQLIAGWKQFDEDRANYQHVEAPPAVVAEAIKDLPSIVVRVSGALTVETNFAAWGVELKGFIDNLPERVPEKLSTDQEFADCKAAIAAFKKAEAQLDAEEARVLSAVPDIDEMKRVKKLLRDMSSTTRLILEKRATSRGQEVKIEIMQEGKGALAAHITGLNKRLAKVQMPPIAADFAAAIKGKKLYSAMRGAVADLVAAKKIESNEIADLIQVNLTDFSLHSEHSCLFPDINTLVMKKPDDFAAAVMVRINNHKAAEQNRLDAEREKIRAEEEAKATAKAKAEQEAAERQRFHDIATTTAREVFAPPTEPAARPAPIASSHRLDETVVAAAPTTHKGITGSARLLDRLDDLARMMTEQELSDLCVHAAHILEQRRVAA